MVGVWQLLLILLIVFSLFGAGKIPQVMEDIGKGIRGLKKGLSEDEKNEKGFEKSKSDMVTKIKKPNKY